MYALLTMVLISPTVLEWNPEPLSVHETYKECRRALDAKAGFKGRPTGTEWLQYSPVLKCEKI